MTVTGFWFAIEDATLENGCLWASPGGHRTGLRKLFKRAGATNDDGTIFEVLDATPLPVPSELVPLPVAAGTLVVLHGLLPHWSDVNRSARSRHAYSLHCIDGEAAYPHWNWLQRSADFPRTDLSSFRACCSIWPVANVKPPVVRSECWLTKVAQQSRASRNAEHNALTNTCSDT